MKPTRGAVVRRGDTGSYGLVIANDMLHQVSDIVILCTVLRSETMAGHSPHAIPIEAADQHLYAIPVLVHTAPASAVAEVVGTADADQLRSVTRTLNAATSP
ncbi:hypothetical protein [Glycomyces terrestris]|uniref:Type II toxin-antitoxin system PemK/MazF family toxin n=1 Tax=Glycomyces terrestris TaxID=2493553 RepID=A0A426URT5_9ACTN|nr:hypothetical protein [Glycomyces terrestris]RRR95798.1 hypothetical protein EIW28_23170 [Glycomyces terrestris]